MWKGRNEYSWNFQADVSVKSHSDTIFQRLTVHLSFLELSGEASGAMCSPVVSVQPEAGIAAKQPGARGFISRSFNLVDILDSFNFFTNDQPYEAVFWCPNIFNPILKLVMC